MDVVRIRIMRDQRIAKRSTGRPAEQRVHKQRNADNHPLPEIADGGNEDRPREQPRMDDDLGNVLVFEPEPVHLEHRGAPALELLDHFSAAAGITGDGVDRKPVVERDKPGIDQRPQQRDRTRGVTTGIGDAFCSSDRLRLLLRQFGKTVGPPRRDAMRGRSIEHFRSGPAQGIDDFHRFLRRVVRQAKNSRVDLRQQLALGIVILALLRRNADEFDVAPAGEFLADFESRRTRLAVDENFRDHCSRPSRAAYTRARFNARICKYRCTIVAAAIAVTSA